MTAEHRVQFQLNWVCCVWWWQPQLDIARPSSPWLRPIVAHSAEMKGDECRCDWVYRSRREERTVRRVRRSCVATRSRSTRLPTGTCPDSLNTYVHQRSLSLAHRDVRLNFQQQKLIKFHKIFEVFDARFLPRDALGL